MADESTSAADVCMCLDILRLAASADRERVLRVLDKMDASIDSVILLAARSGRPSPRARTSPNPAGYALLLCDALVPRQLRVRSRCGGPLPRLARASPAPRPAVAAPGRGRAGAHER